MIFPPGFDPLDYPGYVRLEIFRTFAFELDYNLWCVRRPHFVENDFHYFRFIVFLNLFERVASDRT